MEFLSDFVWLERLSEYLIKSTLILILGIILSYLCRRQSASLRHFILSVSLIGILIFPLLSTVRTGWKTGFLPSWTSEAKGSSELDSSLSTHHSRPSIYVDYVKEKPQSQGSQYPLRPEWTRKTGGVFWNLVSPPSTLAGRDRAVSSSPVPDCGSGRDDPDAVAGSLYDIIHQREIASA